MPLRHAGKNFSQEFPLPGNPVSELFEAYLSHWKMKLKGYHPSCKFSFRFKSAGSRRCQNWVSQSLESRGNHLFG